MTEDGGGALSSPWEDTAMRLTELSSSVTTSSLLNTVHAKAALISAVTTSLLELKLEDANAEFLSC